MPRSTGLCRGLPGFADDLTADLPDERDDAAVVGELQTTPAPGQPIGREHRLTLQADKRPAVTRGNQPQLPGATHSVADAFVRAASTPRATVNQRKSSHGCSFARGHKKATRPTREFGKKLAAARASEPVAVRSPRRGGHRHRYRQPRNHRACPISRDDFRGVRRRAQHHLTGRCSRPCSGRHGLTAPASRTGRLSGAFPGMCWSGVRQSIPPSPSRGRWEGPTVSRVGRGTLREHTV